MSADATMLRDHRRSLAWAGLLLVIAIGCLAIVGRHPTDLAPTTTVPLVGEIDTAPFPIGSQLIMYTDGLVERRDRPLQVGIDQAASHLAALSTNLAPRHVIDSLREALIGSKATDDDIAVLVVEHTATASA